MYHRQAGLPFARQMAALSVLIVEGKHPAFIGIITVLGLLSHGLGKFGPLHLLVKPCPFFLLQVHSLTEYTFIQT